jgi:hypothetical protein
MQRGIFFEWHAENPFRRHDDAARAIAQLERPRTSQCASLRPQPNHNLHAFNPGGGITGDRASLQSFRCRHGPSGNRGHQTGNDDPCQRNQRPLHILLVHGFICRALHSRSGRERLFFGGPIRSPFEVRRAPAVYDVIVSVVPNPTV